MLNEIFYAFIQSITEFLPVSSSGHLALFSNIIEEPNLFFFSALHLASLIAVLIFTRKEVKGLLSFKKEYRKMWIFIITATIPSALFGYFFKDLIEQSFSNMNFLGIAFVFTGIILFFTKFSKVKSALDCKKSFFIGLMQALALFPGVSRSGMTVSAGLYSGISRIKAAKFSFLLFIPLSIGAFILELKNFYFDYSLILPMILCTILSIFFLRLLTRIIAKDKFWMFSFYCWILGIIVLIFG